MSKSKKDRDEVNYQKFCTELRLKYSAVLVVERGKMRPLAIKTRDLMIAENPHIPAWMIARFLRFYSRTDLYIRSLARGGKRVDLHGNETTAVTGKEMYHAQQQLNAISRERSAA